MTGAVLQPEGNFYEQADRLFDRGCFFCRCVCDHTNTRDTRNPERDASNSRHPCFCSQG